METGAWWQRNCPAGDGEAAHVFPSPLDMRSFSSTTPTQMAFEDYSEYEDYYRFEIQGPRDERDLGECFGSPFSPFTNMEVDLTHKIEYGSCSPTSYHGITIQTCVPGPPDTEKVRERRRHMSSAVLPQKEETPATTALRDEREGKEEDDEEKEERREEGGSTWPLHCQWRRRPAPAATAREEGGSTSSIVEQLDNIPKGGSGPRRPRQKGKWWPLPYYFGVLCSSSKVEKPGQRKNNEHWTPEEVKVLVDGVSKLGVGRWSKLKKRWFSDSVRTAENLKDKWRNLREAYTVRPTSKKKVNAPLDKALIKRIQMLAADNPHPK